MPFATPVLPILTALAVGLAGGFLLSVSARPRRWALGAVALVVAWAFIAASTHLIFSPPHFGFDIAWVYNAGWNLAEGRGPWSDVLGASMYGIHGFFLFPLFMPFFWLIDHPSGFLVAQYFYGLAAVVPAYFLARRITGSSECGIALALVYLLHPATSGFLLTESHPIILGPFFLFLYLWAKHAEKPAVMILAAAAAALVYEVFSLGIMTDGLVEAIRRRKIRSPQTAVALAGAAAVLLFISLRPADGWVSGSRHYDALGGSPLGALPLLFRDPGTLLDIVLNRAKLGYMAHMLIPLLGLPLLAPSALALALPEICFVLLGDPAGDMPRINSFYTHTFTVASVHAAALVIGRLRHRIEPRRAALGLCLTVLAMQFTYAHTFVPRMPRTASETAAIFQARVPFPIISLSAIPEGATVLAANARQAYLFPRRRVFVIDKWLSPRQERAHREGRLHYDFLALPAASPAPDSPLWTLVQSDLGVDVYRRSPPVSDATP